MTPKAHMSLDSLAGTLAAWLESGRKWMHLIKRRGLVGWSETWGETTRRLFRHVRVLLRTEIPPNLTNL